MLTGPYIKIYKLLRMDVRNEKKITKYINFKDSAFIWVKVDTHTE